MATWNSRGLRGSTLEEFINRTNEKYLENGLALIQKVPTQSLPLILIRQPDILRWRILTRRVPSITLAQCRGSRSVLTQKECNTDTFPLQNIHEHQVVFMENFEKQMGIAFFFDQFYCKR